jgi:drug/metabolite transporter (DMT)-like permease
MTLANGYSLPGVMGVIGTVIAFYLWYVSLAHHPVPPLRPYAYKATGFSLQ